LETCVGFAHIVQKSQCGKPPKVGFLKRATGGFLQGATQSRSFSHQNKTGGHIQHVVYQRVF
jgi:hypothetical protein